VHGLVALMEIIQAFPLRPRGHRTPSGEADPSLLDQNRGRWDQLLIRRGCSRRFCCGPRASGGPAGGRTCSRRPHRGVPTRRPERAEEGNRTGPRIAAALTTVPRFACCRHRSSGSIRAGGGPRWPADRPPDWRLVDTLVGESAHGGLPTLLPTVAPVDLAGQNSAGTPEARSREFERARVAHPQNLPERHALVGNGATGRPAPTGVTVDRRGGRVPGPRPDSWTPRRVPLLRPSLAAAYENDPSAHATPTCRGVTAGTGRRRALRRPRGPRVAARTWNRHRVGDPVVPRVGRPNRVGRSPDLADRLDRQAGKPSDTPTPSIARASKRCGQGTILSQLRETQRCVRAALRGRRPGAESALSLNVENLDPGRAPRFGSHRKPLGALGNPARRRGLSVAQSRGPHPWAGISG